MARWIIAFLVAAAVGYLAVPRGRSRAFKAGWFERSSQTRRRRSQRRPTHGGLVLAISLTAGTLIAGPSQAVVRAVVLACVVAVVTGVPAEQGKGKTWVLHAGRLAAAAAVPLAGVRAALTGNEALDAIGTALIALVLMAGVRSIERTDATAPLVAATSSAGLLIVAVLAGDPVAPAAAALVGAGGAMVANTWPPAVVRIGTIGPTVLGAALTAVAIELDPGVAAPRSVLVPACCLAVLATAAVIHRWDRRLRSRGWKPRVALPLAAAAGAVAAIGIARSSIEPAVAVAITVGPVLLLAFVALTSPRRTAEGPSSTRALIVGAGVVVIVALAVVAGLLSLDARRSMERGREHAIAGLDAARVGDLDAAQAQFAQADAAFADAADALGSPVLRLGDAVPVAAQNLRNARVLADVGQDLSGTALAVAERAGADDLQMVDGFFPIDAAAEVGDELGTALATLTSASERLDDAGSPFLLDEVRVGSDAVAVRIEDAAASIEVAAEASRLLPGLLGQDEERRWIVALLTPSELRGAGGLAGDYAELQTTAGEVELVETHSAAELNRATDPQVQGDLLPPIYHERYGGFSPSYFWQNLSVTPDVPTFAGGIAASFPALAFGGPVEGVVTIDPIAVEALLELTGPITVPLWPEPITMDNAREVLLFEQYDELTPDQLDELQADLVEALTDALTSGALPGPSDLAATLAPAVAGGHLQLWSPARAEQSLFQRIGADGALAPPSEGDFVQLITQNGSGNKIDWYQRRALTYEPTFDPATGRVTATATITIVNTAPASGVSSYIIGEPDGDLTVPGESRVHVTLITPHNLVRALDAAGRPTGVNLGREQGLTVITKVLRIPSGASSTVRFELEGQVEPTRGSYKLEVGHQPTATADEVSVSVQGAERWEVATPATGSVTRQPEEAVRLRFRLRES